MSALVVRGLRRAAGRPPHEGGPHRGEERRTGRHSSISVRPWRPGASSPAPSPRSRRAPAAPVTPRGPVVPGVSSVPRAPRVPALPALPGGVTRR